jgi:hypothetical protein
MAIYRIIRSETMCPVRIEHRLDSRVHDAFVSSPKGTSTFTPVISNRRLSNMTRVLFRRYNQECSWIVTDNLPTRVPRP